LVDWRKRQYSLMGKGKKEEKKEMALQYKGMF
jgi:hypothetical protein